MKKPMLLLLNDTSRYHSGCGEVMNYLYRDAAAAGFDFHPLRTGELPDAARLEAAAAVLVNGEGTMHHNSKTAQMYMAVLETAQRAGKKTALVNTVWQAMPRGSKYDDMLRRLDVLAVRETRSADELTHRHGVEPGKITLCPDLAYFSRPRSLPWHSMSLRNRPCIGVFFVRQTPFDPGRPHHRMDIMRQTWEEIEQACNRAQVVVTGRHHEFIAACRTRTPCVLLAGNTHKMEGLIESAVAVLPVLSPMASDVLILRAMETVLQPDYLREWARLWEWMEAAAPPSFAASLIP